MGEKRRIFGPQNSSWKTSDNSTPMPEQKEKRAVEIFSSQKFVDLMKVFNFAANNTQADQ